MTVLLLWDKQFKKLFSYVIFFLKCIILFNKIYVLFVFVIIL